MNILKNEVSWLKDIQKSDLESIKLRQQKWDGEREALKEENKALKQENNLLFDLIKVCDVNKEKLKKIKAICDE